MKWEGLSIGSLRFPDSSRILRLRGEGSRPAFPGPSPPSHRFPTGSEEGADHLGTAQLVLSCPVLPQGRNASEQVKMLQRIEEHNARQSPEQKIQVSVEVEKPREELFQLFGYGDVVSIPRSFPLPYPANFILKRSPSIPLSHLPDPER